MRLILSAFILLGAVLPGRAIEAAAIERGTAIIDPLALRELDHGRFSIGAMLLPERSTDIPLTAGQVFAVGKMAKARAAIDREFDRYIAKHRKSLPNATIGVGDGFDFQLFDRALLDAADSRFVLAGIVNRMDRSFVDEAGCGEIRLIYRLTRTAMPWNKEDVPAVRLPMTLNIVLKAKGNQTRDRRRNAITCSDIARRWLAAGALSLTGAELAGKLLDEGGPLDLIDYQNIDRIETNIQIAHAPKSAVRDFRTDYLLKVFRYDAQAREFLEAPMENQIDRDRILADDSLRLEFKSWLLDPGHLAEFDRGMALIPEKFLANGAIATTPVGFDNSDLQPEFGLMQGEGTNPVFAASDVIAALKKAADGMKLQNIRSLAGFVRRLNDVTCSGCHQTRGIGGFHFPGVDWMAEKPSNSTVVPASPHFFGDQVRRRDILVALRDNKPPDYSRGFASRPQLRGNAELAGTEYSDGWGAHCYAPGKPTAGNDASFRGWTCAEGLACQVAGKTSRMGMCFVKSR